MAKYVYPAVFTEEEDGGYSISFPDIPSCYTQGEDMIDGIDLDAIGMNLHARRIATCKYRYELLIRVPLDGSLDAAGQVSITK